MEREAVRAALAGPPSVVVPGAGWAAQPGELEKAAEASFILYLKCQPATAAKRIAGGEVRPLMAGRDPGQQMRELWQAREPFYAKAHADINADSLAAEAVAARVVETARQCAGW